MREPFQIKTLIFSIIFILSFNSPVPKIFNFAEFFLTKLFLIKYLRLRVSSKDIFFLSLIIKVSGDIGQVVNFRTPHRHHKKKKLQ